MSFVSKACQILALQLTSWFKPKTSIQRIVMKYKLISNLCMIYMVRVFNTLWRIKNQPSNFTSCSDNALRLLVLVAGKLYWGLQVMSSFSIWGCVLKGCFERGIFWRPKSRLKGIEDFIFEHCNQACICICIYEAFKATVACIKTYYKFSLITHEAKGPWPWIACENISSVVQVETVQVHFTLL